MGDGKAVRDTWEGTGSPKTHGERAVTDDEIRQFLQELLETEYWTFRGTRFIPDYDDFRVRFHYKDLTPVEYYCQAHEYEPSQSLLAIRDVVLTFVGVLHQSSSPLGRAAGHTVMGAAAVPFSQAGTRPDGRGAP